MRPLESHRRTTVESGAIYSTRFTRIFARISVILLPFLITIAITSKFNCFGVFSCNYVGLLWRAGRAKCDRKWRGKSWSSDVWFWASRARALSRDRPSIFLFSPSFSGCADPGLCVCFFFRFFILIYLKLNLLMTLIVWIGSGFALHAAWWVFVWFCNCVRFFSLFQNVVCCLAFVFPPLCHRVVA